MATLPWDLGEGDTSTRHRTSHVSGDMVLWPWSTGLAPGSPGLGELLAESPENELVKSPCGRDFPSLGVNPGNCGWVLGP